MGFLLALLLIGGLMQLWTWITGMLPLLYAANPTQPRIGYDNNGTVVDVPYKM
jgi:hypothetical protein